MNRLIRIGSWLLLVVLAGLARLVAQSQVLLISDLHFDPLAGASSSIDEKRSAPCDRKIVTQLMMASPDKWEDVLRTGPIKSSPYGQDTNYALLRSSLSAMKAKTGRPILIMISGDLLVHEFHQKFNECLPQSPKGDFAAFVDKTVTFIANEIGAAFPEAQIIPALGNNDSACGDYMMEVNGQFFRHFVKSWAKLVRRPRGAHSDFKGMAAYAGYYSVTLAATPEIEVIVTNTTVWSARFQNTCGQTDTDPGIEELAWFRATLQQATSAHKRVWILGHIPPGINVKATLGTSGSHVVPMYDDVYNSAFIDAIHDSSIIQIGFFGHTHHNEFRLLDAGSRNVPLQLVPSISPRNSNNPAFLVLTVDPQFSPQDYIVYILKDLDSDQWSKEYTFQEAYGEKGLLGDNFLNLSVRIAKDQAIRERFAAYFTSQGRESGITQGNWRSYWCSYTNLDVASFVRCLSGSSGDLGPTKEPLKKDP